MRDLIGRYTYHGGPNEHKGPSDFNGGGDDGSDEDGDGTPPATAEMLEAHMMPAHYPGQAPPQFPQFRHHTPSASPPIPNGVGFPQHPGAAQMMQRAHTPQPPQVGSRPGSRNDMRRMPSNVPQPGQSGNGYAFMPNPAIYNPQAQQNMPAMSQPGPQYPYAAPPTTHAPAQPMHHFVDERPASMPPSFPTHGTQAGSLPPPPPPLQQRHSVSPPQAHSQQLAAQAQTHPSSRASTPHAGSLLPPPPHQQKQHPEQPSPPVASQSQPQIQEPQPPTPVESRSEAASDWAVKKLPQRKHQNYSIFTPIDESRSILSQHLEAFRDDSIVKVESNDNGTSSVAGHRSLSVDSGHTPSRNSITSSPPTARATDGASQQMPQPKSRASMSSIPETMFTPPSRQNSLRPGGGGGGGLRPRLRVEIPPDGSEENSTAGTGESASSPRNAGDATPAGARRNGEPHTGIVLPPPSPSASTLLSAGASGPPNPFARPAPPQNNNNNSNNNSNNNNSSSNTHINTPGSALPSHFMNSELLPSPSSFYPSWDFGRGNDSTTLPSPLNFQTPVNGTGPSFLRDDVIMTGNKRKSPDVSASGPSSDAADKNDAKRVKVEH